MNNIRIINQAVDTYKEHYYPSLKLSESEIIDYNDFVLDLIDIKKEAQKQKNNYKDERFIKETINDKTFNIMSTTQKGFAVTIKNNDVSISFKRFKTISKQPCIKVEYRADYLARYGYVKCVNQIRNFIKFIIPYTKSVASEIHLCTDIQGYDFTILDLYSIRTRARTKEAYHETDLISYFDSLKMTSMHFGSGDFRMRIYNKTEEIKKHPTSGFVKPSRWFYSSHYDEEKTVWRIEVQIRREKLKYLFKEHNFLDDSNTCLNSLSEIWTLFMQKISHKSFTDYELFEIIRGKKTYKNGKEKLLSKYAIRKRFKNATESNMWSTIQDFNETKGSNLTYIQEINKPSKIYVQNSFKALVSTFTKHSRGKFNPFDLANLLVEANEENKLKKDMSIFDEAKLKTVDYMNEVNHTYEVNSSKFGVFKTDDFKEYESDLENNILALFSTYFPNENPSQTTLKNIVQKLGYVHQSELELCI